MSLWRKHDKAGKEKETVKEWLVEPGADAEEIEMVAEAESVITIDDIVEHIGGFGRYQAWMFAITFFTMLVNGCVNLQQIAVERVPTSACAPPESSAQPALTNCTLCSGDANEFEGFFLDQSSVGATFRLVCGRAILRGWLGSIFFVGFAGGAFLGGSVSDSKGRKQAVLLTSVLMILGSQTWLSGSYEIYALGRALSGVACGAGMTGNYVLMMEWVGKKHRGWMGGFGMGAPWSLGGLVMCLYAGAVRGAAGSGGLSPDTLTEWRAVALLPAILCVIQGLLVLRLPESPRWLLSDGKPEAAMALLRAAAAYNKVAMPPGSLTGGGLVTKPTRDPEAGGGDDEDEGKGCGKKEGKMGVGVLFSSRLVLGLPMWKVTCRNLLNWFTAAFVYYGLALNTGNLGGDFYTNASLAMAVDLPALALSVPMFDYIGRARTLALTLLLGGGACGLGPFLAHGGKCAGGGECPGALLQTLLASFGKMNLCIALSGIFIYASEAFPTPVRTQALGISSVAARVGGVAAPLVVLLGVASPDLPMYVFAVIGLLTGASCLWLPETNNQELTNDV